MGCIQKEKGSKRRDDVEISQIYESQEDGESVQEECVGKLILKNPLIINGQSERSRRGEEGVLSDRCVSSCAQL